MKTTSKRRAAVTVADDYLDLVRAFPLRPIRDEAEYDRGITLFKDLVGRAAGPDADADDGDGLSAGERDYLDALRQFIGGYEERHFPIEPVLKTPLARLKYLMEQSGMSSTDLGELLGSGRGQASLILNGKRELSKANIRKLADRFKVSAAAFL